MFGIMINWERVRVVIKINFNTMKRLEPPLIEVTTTVIDLPHDIKAEILLRYVNYELGSLNIWHEIQKIFRMIPKLGEPETREAFYLKIRRITPRLFTIFYQTMEYPRFLGLVKFQPTEKTEKEHLQMVPLMKNLLELDISEFRRRFPVDALTGLTSLKVNYATEPSEIASLSNLVSLNLFSLHHMPYEILQKLTKLEKLSILPDSIHDRGGNLTIEVMKDLVNLKKLSVKEDGYDNSFRVFEEMESFSILPNLTCLKFGGPLTIASKMFPVIPNLKKLHIERFTDETNGHFSILTNLEALSVGKNFNYIFNDDDLAGLSNLTSLVIKSGPFYGSEISKLTRLTDLSIGQKVDSTFESSFKSISMMTNLELLEFCVASPGDKIFWKLEKLQYLNLCGNRFSSDRCLLRLTNLTRLELDRNTPLSRNAINRLPKLTNFNVPCSDFYCLKEKLESLDKPNINICPF